MNLPVLKRNATVFGPGIKRALTRMFCMPSNLFSFQNVYFAELEEKKAGMILVYTSKTKRRVNFRTGLHLFGMMGSHMFRHFKTPFSHGKKPWVKLKRVHFM